MSSFVVVPIVLVGNMKDVRFLEYADLQLTKNLVKKADAYAKGYKINAYGCQEVSAKFNDGVLDLLKIAIDATSDKKMKYLSSTMV